MRQFIFTLVMTSLFFSCKAQVGSESNEEIKNSNSINTYSSPLNAAPAYNSTTINSADSVTFKIESKKEAKGKSYKMRSKDLESTKTTQLNNSFNQTKRVASRQDFQRSPTIEQQVKMDEISKQMLEDNPEGMESNLNYYSAGNYSVDREVNLKKAQNLQPQNPDILKYVAANALIKDNKEEAKISLSQLNAMSTLSNESISYGQDIVESACGNSTLITHGFNDTYGVSYVQINNYDNCSSNLNIISLDFLQSDFYRKRLSNDGYYVPQSKIINVAFLKEFCEKNSFKNIAISMTLPKPYLIELAPKLYPAGVVFEYGDKPRKSYEELANLWNKKLNKKVIYNYQSPLSNKLSANYLPLLIYLSQYNQNNSYDLKQNQYNTEIKRIMEKAKLNKK